MIRGTTFALAVAIAAIALALFGVVACLLTGAAEFGLYRLWEAREMRRRYP
jgi:hypothetical protein